MGSLDRIEELTSINNRLLDLIQELEQKVEQERSRAFRDAAYVFENAAKIWGVEGVDAFRRSYAALGYNEAAYVLVNWANNPKVIDDILAKRDKIGNSNSAPTPSSSGSNGEATGANGNPNADCPDCAWAKQKLSTRRVEGYPESGQQSTIQ